MKPTLGKDGFYESGNSYWMLKGCCEIRITNFTIDPVNKITIEGKKYYRCLLKSDSGESNGINIPDNGMNTIKRFNKQIAEYGNFVFLGDEKDFLKFWKWLIDELWRIHDCGEFRGFDQGDETIATVRTALKEGRVRCIELKEPICFFSVYPRSGMKSYRLYRMRTCDAIAVIRQIPIIPFSFIIKENERDYGFPSNPEEGGEE